FGDYNGATKFDGSNWVYFNSSNSSLISNRAISIAQDQNNVLWLAQGITSGGLSAYDGNTWYLYNSLNSGLSNSLVFRVIVNPFDNTKWIHTGVDISIFDDYQWTHLNAIDENGNNIGVGGPFIDTHNNKWFWSSNAGAFKFDGQWTQFNKTNSGIIDNWVFDIAEDKNGNIWFATATGASKFDGNNWENFDIQNSPISTYLFSVEVDVNGDIWFGSVNQIHRFQSPQPQPTSILSIKVSGSSLIKRVAISSSKEFDEIGTQSEEMLRTVEIGQDNTAYFSEEIIQDFGNNIQRLDLLTENNQLMGHILFEFKQEDLQNGKTIDLFLRLHPDLSTNRLDYPGWEYYSDTYVEWPTSMLIAPQNSFDSIKTDQKPILLVHGVSGSYPYWYDTPKQLETSNQYDIWQFYYPYDGEIETSGIMERRAIDDILDQNITNQQYSVFRVSVVAHSMGGLVTRSYIQSLNGGESRINKFMMLGTPNNGSYSAYRIYYTHMPDEFGFLFGSNKDDQAPAYLQMTSGSSFLTSLNKEQLSQSLSTLVVAGTQDFSLGIPHNEILNQDDGLVSVSSASLLNYPIPLSITPLTHTFTNRNLTNSSSNIVMNFLSDSYSFETFAQLPEITGAWKNSIDPPLKVPTENFDTEKGMLVFSIDGSHQEKLFLQENGDGDIKLSHHHFTQGIYQLQKVPKTDNYFGLNTSGLNDLGIGFTEGSHDLIFQYYDRYLSRWIKYKKSDLEFHYLQTNMKDLILSDGELAILNSENELQTGSNNSLAFAKTNSISNIQENIKTYIIDGATTGAVFLINAETGENNFSQHNMKLVSPSGREIDPVVASTDPNIEFKEDVTEGFAFYYIANPEIGTWTLQTNEAVQTVTSVPIVSQASVNISVTTGNYFTGDQIPFSVTTSANTSNPSLNVSVQKQNGSIWTSVGNASISAVNDTSFTGDAVVGLQGTYRLQANLTGELNGESFTRIDISESFWVQQLVLPEIRVDISLENSVFYLGDTATCNITISGDYNNPDVTFSVWKKDSLGVWRDFDDGVVTRLNSTHYKGQFIALEIGEYRFRVEATDIVDGYSVQDSDYELFNVISLPEILLSLSIPDSSLYAGDSTLCTILLIPSCENPMFVFFIQKQNTVDDDILVWENKDTLEVETINDTLFTVKFALANTGIYRIQAEITCTIDGKELGTEDSLSFSVIPLPPMQLFLSMVDSVFYQSDTISCKIVFSGILESPQLNLSLWKYNEDSWNSIQVIQTISIDDTTFIGSFISADTGSYQFKAFLSGLVDEHLQQVSDSLFFLVLPDTITTGVSSQNIPQEFSLKQNYPNPFNPSTIIEYSIPTQSHVELKIFNILGQEVLTLVNGIKEIGNYKVFLDMTRYPSGVYVYQIRASNFREVKKLLFIK
ncbi:T9SS type A sorting domain-containing protein, partial [Candidatus Gracilibacteria bacterium]|nr:T9SS type A sorting domain-containing protein [Candidatus Gracilibacteria bacterium]